MKMVKVKFLDQCILPLSSRFFNRGDETELEEGFAKRLEGRKLVKILDTKKTKKKTTKPKKEAKKPKKEIEKPKKEVEKPKKEEKKD